MKINLGYRDTRTIRAVGVVNTELPVTSSNCLRNSKNNYYSKFNKLISEL